MANVQPTFIPVTSFETEQEDCRVHLCACPSYYYPYPEMLAITVTMCIVEFAILLCTCLKWVRKCKRSKDRINDTESQGGGDNTGNRTGEVSQDYLLTHMQFFLNSIATLEVMRFSFAGCCEPAMILMDSS